MQDRVRQSFLNCSESWSEICWHPGTHCLEFPQSFLPNSHTNRRSAAWLLIVNKYWPNTIRIHANAFGAAGHVLSREAGVHSRQMSRRENGWYLSHILMALLCYKWWGLLFITELPEHILFLTASSPVMETHSPSNMLWHRTNPILPGAHRGKTRIAMLSSDGYAPQSNTCEWEISRSEKYSC